MFEWYFWKRVFSCFFIMKNSLVLHQHFSENIGEEFVWGNWLQSHCFLTAQWLTFQSLLPWLFSQCSVMAWLFSHAMTFQSLFSHVWAKHLQACMHVPSIFVLLQLYSKKLKVPICNNKIWPASHALDLQWHPWPCCEERVADLEGSSEWGTWTLAKGYMVQWLERLETWLN